MRLWEGVPTRIFRAWKFRSRAGIPLRGRPKGALNRKTKDFERYYQAQSFTVPLVAMAQYLIADPVEFYHWFVEYEPNPNRRPALMEIINERLPTLIIDLGTNQLREGQRIAGQKALSAGQPEDNAEPNEINELEAGG